MKAHLHNTLTALILAFALTGIAQAATPVATASQSPAAAPTSLDSAISGLLSHHIRTDEEGIIIGP